MGGESNPSEVASRRDYFLATRREGTSKIAIFRPFGSQGTPQMRVAHARAHTHAQSTERRCEATERAAEDGCLGSKEGPAGIGKSGRGFR